MLVMFLSPAANCDSPLLSRLHSDNKLVLRCAREVSVLRAAGLSPPGGPTSPLSPHVRPAQLQQVSHRLWR
jgi:hypothetical protein